MELRAESSAAGGGVLTRTVVSRDGEEAAVALTATRIGFSFAASLGLLDMGEAREVASSCPPDTPVVTSIKGGASHGWED